MREAELSAIHVSDPSQVATARQSMSCLILEMPYNNGVLLVNHDNSARSHAPQGHELRVLARALKAVPWESHGERVMAEREAAGPPQCISITKKGTQCKKNALEGSDFCATHK